ncbi:MAG: hypothetical protein QM770_10335 [Tepidisphaeraceae bacterium]
MHDQPDPLVQITIRVPGPWETPQDLFNVLPEGFNLEGQGSEIWLTGPDGIRAALQARPRDEQFFPLWLEGCNREPTQTEVSGVKLYRHTVLLTMPGGSFDRAVQMLKAGAAILEAGGYGVFVDNSGIGHGASDWLDLTEDTGPDGGGPFWGFVNTFGDDENLWTHGMHVLGFRDAQMPRTGDDKKDDFHIRNFLAYTYRSGATIKDGDDLGDDLGPLYKVKLIDDDRIESNHPMFNPFGRYQLQPLPRGNRASPN